MKKQKFYHSLSLPTLITLITIGIMLFGCQTKEEIPFETIDEGLYTESGKGYMSIDPDFIVITSMIEAKAIDVTHHHEANDVIEKLDFSKFFVIGVYQGVKPTNGYHIEIQRITQMGDSIIISANFKEPDLDIGVGPLQTSPRQLVKVPLNELHGEFNFILEVNGQVELTKTYVFEQIALNEAFPEQTVLEYVAKREEVSINSLEVLYFTPYHFEILKEHYWVADVFNHQTEDSYEVLVNMSDGSFVDSLAILQAEESSAQQEKYGILEPALYERLQTMGDLDEVKVAIWVRSKQRPYEEMVAEMAARFPDVQEALENNRDVLDIQSDDLEHIREVKKAWMEIQTRDANTQIQMLAEELEALGYEVNVFDGMPSLAVTLSKQEILDLAERADIGVIYLLDLQVIPEFDSVVPNNQEPVIPFETIEKAQLSGTGEEYAGTEPKIVVITHPNEIDDVGNWISFDVQEVLRTQDYNQSIILIIFRGKRAFYVDIEVQRVTARGNEIVVEADIFPWSVEHPLPDISISPYHVIKIPRAYLFEESKFVLIASYLPETP